MLNLTSRIVELIENQNKKDGLDVSKLKCGTVVRVKTKNSEYRLEILEDYEVIVQGGKYFPVPTQAIFKGSTWGSSMLKMSWIGQDMKMEFSIRQENGLHSVETSGVQSIEVEPESLFFIY